MILSLLALIVSVALFVVADALRPNTIPQSVLSQLAGVVLATGLLSVGWELLGRRHFAREVLETARLSAEVADSGITRITDLYLQQVEWDSLFEGVAKLDIVVAYGRTWRNTHSTQLSGVAARKGTQLRVFLPDPSDDRTMEVLADRFNRKTGDLVTVVNEAITDFTSLATDDGGSVEVYTRPGDAVFSCYRFDQRAVLTMYSHARVRTTVPTFSMREGTLFAFVTREIDAIATQSTRIYPPPD